MKIIEQKKVNILDWEKSIGCELVVSDKVFGASKYHAYMPEVWKIFPGGLGSISGHGDTVEEAVRDYCRLISGKKISIKAFSENPVEGVAPELVYEQPTSRASTDATTAFLSEILKVCKVHSARMWGINGGSFRLKVGSEESDVYAITPVAFSVCRNPAFSIK